MDVLTADTLEGNLKIVDTVLQRLARRSQKVTSVVMPAIPISQYIGSTEVAESVRYMFPISGTITALVAAVDNMPSRTNLMVNIERISSTTTINQYKTSTTALTEKLDLAVSAGDRVKISFETDNEVVEGIWIAFAWTPNTSHSSVAKLAINDLDLLQESFLGDLNE